MTEYDELIAALRFCDGGECDGCCKYIKGKGTHCYTLLRDAADAIEKLKRENERWEEAMKTALDFIPCWLPIQSRPMTAEERKEYRERTGYELDKDEAVIYTSKLPDGGQDVLVSYTYSGDVGIDTFCDDPDFGCFFEKHGEMNGISAWMPLPKPYKEEPHGA